MNEEKYWNLMSRYLANDLSLAETDELLTWMDDDPSRAVLFRELQDTWDRTQNYPGHLQVDPQVAWNKVKQSVETTDQKIRSIPVLRLMRVAASLLVLLTAGIMGYRYYENSKLIHVETQVGEHREVILPDGSKVYMNEASELAYHANFNNRSLREVELNGEAFFEVKKNPDRRFVISTGKTLTQVLGTSFNVKKDNNGTISVAVLTGRVSFGPADDKKKEYILLPGDQANYQKDGAMERGKYDNTNFLFWKDHRLAFENVAFGKVLNTLEKACGVRFLVEDKHISELRITTSFNQASLDEVVNVFQELLDLKITKSGSTYVVKNNKKP